MKVSKKCIQKMKNRPCFRRKSLRICALVFLLSLFLCSSVLGSSVSALQFVQPVKVRFSMGTPSTLMKVWTEKSGGWSEATNYFASLGYSSDTIVGLEVEEQTNWFFTQGELVELKFLISYSKDTTTILGVENCTYQEYHYTYCFDSEDKDFLMRSIRSALPNKYRLNDLQLDLAGNSVVMTVNLFVRQDVAAPTGPIQLFRSVASINSGNMMDFPVGSSIQFLSYNVYAVNFDNAGEVLEQQAEEEKKNTNSQVEAGSSAGDKSSSDASAQGSTLLAAFQSFIGALTSASPSNCVLNMDLGNLDLGSANLCSISPPPAFQIISSVVLIGFCVPLSIATAKKVISLFRSFQN